MGHTSLRMKAKTNGGAEKTTMPQMDNAFCWLSVTSI